MLSPKMQEALNAQINAELHAFYTYLSMSAYFESESLPGFAAWMRHHSDEEMVHAMKIYDYVLARRGRVRLQPIVAPTIDWPSAQAVLEDALKHEQNVTALINGLVDAAYKEKDHASHSFLEWFVEEQVEEEQIVDLILEKIKRNGDFGPGLLMLDREVTAMSGGEDEEED
jgi:ferritin